MRLDCCEKEAWIYDGWHAYVCQEESEELLRQAVWSGRQLAKQTRGLRWGEGPEKKHQGSDLHLTWCSQWLPKVSRHTHLLWKQHCSPRTLPRSTSVMLKLHRVYAFSRARDNWIWSGHWPSSNRLPLVRYTQAADVSRMATPCQLPSSFSTSLQRRLHSSRDLEDTFPGKRFALSPWGQASDRLCGRFVIHGKYLESLHQTASLAHLLNPVIALYLKDSICALKLSSEEDAATSSEAALSGWFSNGKVLEFLSERKFQKS